MKTLLQIQDEVAKENGYDSWDGIVTAISEHCDTVQNVLWLEVCRRSCEETGRLTLDKAAENAYTIYGNHFGPDIIVNKSSITDPSNIVIPE